MPLLVVETTTRSLQALARRDSDTLVWWGSQVGCASSLARLERAVLLDVKGAALAFDRLKQLADGWREIEPSEIVRENALRFLRVHPLRAADALQLAAAFLAAERRPSSLQVVTLDERLGDAARREGFELIGRYRRLSTSPGNGAFAVLSQATYQPNKRQWKRVCGCWFGCASRPKRRRRLKDWGGGGLDEMREGRYPH